MRKVKIRMQERIQIVENANSKEAMLSWYGHIGMMDERRVLESLKLSLVMKLMITYIMVVKFFKTVSRHS